MWLHMQAHAAPSPPFWRRHSQHVGMPLAKTLEEICKSTTLNWRSQDAGCRRLPELESIPQPLDEDIGWLKGSLKNLCCLQTFWCLKVPQWVSTRSVGKGCGLDFPKCLSFHPSPGHTKSSPSVLSFFLRFLERSRKQAKNNRREQNKKLAGRGRPDFFFRSWYAHCLPLVSREWKSGSNSSYNCTPFLHSLLRRSDEAQSLSCTTETYCRSDMGVSEN